MSDLLSTDEAKSAAVQGWTLCHVFDQSLRVWRVQILPPAFSRDIPNARAALNRVLDLARGGDKLALKALRMVASQQRK